MLDSANSQVPTAAVAAPSVDALEREITTLAAHLDAATYQFLTLIADFDRRGGWDGFGGGVRSCAHWLNWKCGIGLVAAREKLRVAHALGQLPLISEAMRRGALSYAKVRAITRVATPENEEFLLTIAQNGTATHVETVVRHYRRTQRLEELEHDRTRHEARSLRYYWDDDGCLVIEGRLPPEQGAVVVKALEAAEQTLRDAHAAPPRASKQAADEHPQREQRASAEDHELTNLNPPLGAHGYRAQRASAEAFSLESWDNRRSDALALMAETLLAGGAEALRSGDKYLVHVHVDLSALSSPEAEGASAIQDGPPLPPETVRRLCCDSRLVTWLEDVPGRTLDVGRKTRTIPPALRRALDKRDQGCQFPGCTNHRFVDTHHIEHWADGGETKLENLTLVCRYHHRLLHEGGFSVSRQGDKLCFADPAGRSIPAVPLAPEVPKAGAAFLSEQHAHRGIRIDDETSIPDWRGERADYDHMVTVLWQREDRTRERIHGSSLSYASVP